MFWAGPRQQSRGEGVALAGGQITGLGCYHGLWNMELRASHVLAQGAGTSDVVGDMWKLSKVYPAQPKRREREQPLQQANPYSGKQTQGRFGVRSLCELRLCALLLACRFGRSDVYVCMFVKKPQ